MSSPAEDESTRSCCSCFFGGGDLLKELETVNGILKKASCTKDHRHLPLVSPDELKQVQQQQPTSPSIATPFEKPPITNEKPNIPTVTVRCIENLELWVNHIACANGRQGELFLRGTSKDYGSNKPGFFRDYNVGCRSGLLDEIVRKDRILIDLLRKSNDTNEQLLRDPCAGGEITQFAQRLAVLQHYEQIQSIGIDVTKDPKVAVAFAYNTMISPARRDAKKNQQTKKKKNQEKEKMQGPKTKQESKKNQRDGPVYVYGFFVPGPWANSSNEPRVQSNDRDLVCMDLAAFLPATAKRPRLQKGQMLYNAKDLRNLKTICEINYSCVAIAEDQSEAIEEKESLTNHDMNKGWDANEYAIVRFQIPEDIGFDRFFACHGPPGSHMTMQRLLEADGLMERLTAAIKSAKSSECYGGVELLKELQRQGGILRKASCKCFSDDVRCSTDFGGGAIPTLTVGCIENLELWVNHIASANGRIGEIFLRGTNKETNKPPFFRHDKEDEPSEILEKRASFLKAIACLDKILLDLFNESNDCNEKRLASPSPGEEISQFAQRLAILQHYEKVDSIGIEVTKDPKIAASFAFGSNTAKKGRRYVDALFVRGPLTRFTAAEPRVRVSAKSGLVCMDLAACLPATAKRPRLQKGHMIYRSSDLTHLKTFCDRSQLSTSSDKDVNENIQDGYGFIHNEGWDATKYAIVRFCIPDDVTFLQFFKCHAGSQMDRKRLLKEDELMQRITLAADKNIAGLSWEEQYASISSAKKKQLVKKDSSNSLSRKSTHLMDRLVRGEDHHF